MTTTPTNNPATRRDDESGRRVAPSPASLVTWTTANRGGCTLPNEHLVGAYGVTLEQFRAAQA